MGDFGRKIDRFIEIFVEQRGYVRVLEGLQNTVMIAVVGLISWCSDWNIDRFGKSNAKV